ncbi:phosphotransferase family protein [Actinokineospora sp.]|uniref:phosphotransferase family protein n=1 Tax=Actinokineospora sp. TaxID=1872133 RepID=UPI004037665E
MAWDDLPQPVRDVVEQHFGPVAGADEIVAGGNSDIACVLRLDSGRSVFLKGVAGVSRRMRWLRNEIACGQVAAGVAPRVLFHADIDAAEAGENWLLVAYEHVPGRPASLAPGSPDLPLIAATIERISAMPAPGMTALRERWAPTDWWTRLAPETVVGWDVEEMTRLAALVPDLVDGDRLLHTDLHGDQFIIGDTGSVHVIDWGFPGAGAPWVDTAFMILRLIEAGHRPETAESWARARSSFADIQDEGLTAFAVYVAGFWSHLAATGGSGSPHRARLARGYAAWRLRRTLVTVI